MKYSKRPANLRGAWQPTNNENDFLRYSAIKLRDGAGRVLMRACYVRMVLVVRGTSVNSRAGIL